MKKVDLGKIKKAYFIGIKGSGVAAVAEILKKRGIGVSGSDTEERFYTDEILKRNKIPFKENFSVENIPEGVDIVIYSTAYSEKNNVEMEAVFSRNLPVYSYPQILGELLKEKKGIAVCGTHGKTTTTALLAHSMKEAGADPGAIVGSQVLDWGSSVLGGSGKYFVAESDEYQNKFKYYDPFAVVLTSVDFDHPDFFSDFKEYKKIFKDFVSKIPISGFLVAWGDSRDVLEVSESAKCQIIKYGFEGKNDIVANKNEYGGFEVKKGGESLGNFDSNLIGDHNILNSTASIAVCHKLGLDLEKVKKAISSFKGTSRRFELIGRRNGAILVDDYAHHPEEIKATLRAAREKYPGKNIITIFHPHTFTRTKALLEDFSKSFKNTDRAIIIDIYGSARETQGGVSSEELVDLVNKTSPGKAEYIPSIEKVIESLKDSIGERDLVISMGAGNVWEVTHKLNK